MRPSSLLSRISAALRTLPHGVASQTCCGSFTEWRSGAGASIPLSGVRGMPRSSTHGVMVCVGTWGVGRAIAPGEAFGRTGEPLREGSMHLVAVRLDFSKSSTNAWEDAVRWRCGHAMRGVGVSVPAAV